MRIRAEQKNQYSTMQIRGRRIVITVLAVLLLYLTAVPAMAATWEFDTPEQGKVPGKNPFTPRGYLVDTGKGQKWLSSSYGNDGEVIQYTGVKNGVDWLDASSSYKLYAMTDRNPTPGKNYLVAWKNGKKISGFGQLAGTPGRGDAVDPSNNGTCWVIPLKGFQFEPGSYYEFGFYQGMMANNGITLVLSEDGNRSLTKWSMRAIIKSIHETQRIKNSGGRIDGTFKFKRMECNRNGLRFFG